MGLRERLQRENERTPDLRKALYERFGVLENPFPTASQTSGHPRLDNTPGDERIVAAIKQFELSYTSQVLVVEGSQGVGKTNFLNYYQQEIEDLYQADSTFYIIRYYPDPEPTFDAIVRRVFQELNQQNHLKKMAVALAESPDEASEIIELARSYEMRIVLHKLYMAEETGGEDTDRVAEAAMEWLVGLRLLNKHRDALGVQFRLDTVESKTQALRDLVFISERLGLLKGIFLLLDELEKQDYSLSKTPVLKYLLAIRALIDALPRRLFLVLAITDEARRRYFAMLPAIAGRLETRIILRPLQTAQEAKSLTRFYEDAAKRKARQEEASQRWTAGTQELISDRDIDVIFEEAFEDSADRGIEGVTHRDLLNRLRDQAEARFAEAR